ncbi:DNA/RNA-binding protein KIN17-like [Mya arenaria]|uniref:DNA/RNA-binding protein KIN17-like n=1 Tax=Mya arenaria TaxID=6604 RepID=UPI0022E58E96|nr:DNA/RNA-binding protein KIN17-like [Mya arenaria]
MGKEKGGFLTPKAIANRIKSKGLQKLRWYCQMCQKQCRDENGFKCHMLSESHQRQLLLFAENPDQYVDSFSKDFQDGYLELLRRRFGTKRVHSNIVYQEYISMRDHTHMNSTQWETLTDFVKWLGRDGLCEVDSTEKGWFVKYIDRDPETIKKQEAVQAKERMDMDDNERAARFIQEQVERGAKVGKPVPETEYTELVRENEEEKVTLSLGGAKKTETAKAVPVENIFKKPMSATGDEGKPGPSQREGRKPAVGEKRKSALDEIMKHEEGRKEKMNRRDHWLHENIVVKVVSKKLGDKYYKRKAYVKAIQDVYGAVIKMLDSGDKIRVDQSHLETVIPALGKTVLLVNGAYRSQTATLEEINEKKFCCTVSLNSGPLKGRVLEKVPYEDLCKVYQPS